MTSRLAVPASSESAGVDRRHFLGLLSAAAFGAAACWPLRAAAFNSVPPSDWTTPLKPFRIAGNLYYVGSRDLASYLITSPRGHILINSNLPTSPAQIATSIGKVGFSVFDVKTLLISHAHNDHCAGSAALCQLSGAKYMVMDEDVSVVESGGKTDFAYGSDAAMRFPPMKVDHALQDGEQVTLDSTVLTAHKTAGHTKGCTTWTMTVEQAGKPLNVVIVGGVFAGSRYNLINDRSYPQMAADFAQTFSTLRALPCDIFLGAHGIYFDLLSKYARMRAGHSSAFVDAAGYKQFVDESEKTFEATLAQQQKAAAAKS